MADFLGKDYDKNENLNETSSRYMKLETGDNKFRILDSAIVGWEWWEATKEGGRTPKRIRIDEKIDVSSLEDPGSVKRFWAMPVWNYKLGVVQILEITQKGIQATLKGLVKNEDWGSPTGYDITIVREGETMQDTKYEVIPSPPRELSKDIKDEFESMHINLDALYEGLDPFKEEQLTDKDIDDIDTILN